MITIRQRRRRNSTEQCGAACKERLFNIPAAAAAAVAASQIESGQAGTGRTSSIFIPPGPRGPGEPKGAFFFGG